MIICPKCGNVCEDHSNFCLKCGYSLKGAGSADRNTEGGGQAYPTGDDETFIPGQISPKKQKKGKFRWILFIPLLAAAAAVFLAFNVFTRTREVIDLEKCVDVSFTGYDGDGSAVMTINTSRLEEQIEASVGKDADQYDAEGMAYLIKLDGTVKKHAEDKDGGKKSADTDDVDEEEQDSEDVEENDLNHLDRGDIITVTIDYAELQARYKELEFSGRNKDVEVDEGLKDYKVIDPFLHVQPAFSGTSPFGTAEIKTIEDKVPAELRDLNAFFWYELNKVDDIAVGDTLVLKFTQQGKHDWKEKGLKPARSEMTYEVTGKDLPKFVTEMREISEDDMAEMQAEARDRVISYLVSYYNQKNTEYVGAYLMVPKEGNWNNYSTKSFLYLVFKAQVKRNDETTEEKWLAVASSSIRKLKESSEAGDLYDSSEDNQVFDITQFSSVSSYESQDDLYNDLILKRSEYKRDPEYAGAEQGAGR